MIDESNLQSLLKNMKPELHQGEYVFCQANDSTNQQLPDLVMMFCEKEGQTLILPKETADRLNLSYTFVAAWITLTVYSDLETVGFTAAFSSAIAAQGIGCNVVAGFHHDHLFVSYKDSERAISILNSFSE